MEKKNKSEPSALKIASIAVFILFFAGVTVYFIHEYRAGHFSDADSLDEYIASYGVLAPIVLTVFQCVKVLYAIVPGAVGCIAGAQMFGTVGGFLCSYVGICLGSFAAFLLSRKYGMRLLNFIFTGKRFERYSQWMTKKHRRYPVFLWLAICFPFSPDDFLCYFSGLTSISFKKFALIILTAKPWTILGYSIIFGRIFF